MADEADRAAYLAEHAADVALANHLSRERGPGSPICVDCGDEIGAARRAAVPWACRCMDCQEAYELEIGQVRRGAA